MRQTRSIIALAALGIAMASCTSDVSAPSDDSLVETHRAILNGVVEGEHQVPLEGVEVVVQFDDASGFPAPTQRTDGAGEFEFVLALYNSDNPAADSSAATVYAIARDGRGNVQAITHK